MSNKLQKKLREIAKREQERERIREQEEQAEIDAENGEDVKIISTNSKQYKALIARLEKHDNPCTDAVRMALLYLESGGKVGIDQFEKYIC